MLTVYLLIMIFKIFVREVHRDVKMNTIYVIYRYSTIYVKMFSFSAVFIPCSFSYLGPFFGGYKKKMH